MLTVRPDAPERLAEALTVVTLVCESKSPEVIGQHMGRLERILEMLRDSIETRNDG